MKSPFIDNSGKAAFMRAANQKIDNDNSLRASDRREILLTLGFQKEIQQDTISSTVREHYGDRISKMEINRETGFFMALFLQYAQGEFKPCKSAPQTARQTGSGYRRAGKPVYDPFSPKRQLATIAFARTKASVEAWKAMEARERTWDPILKPGVAKAISRVIDGVLRLQKPNFSDQQVMNIVENVISGSTLKDEAAEELREQFTIFLKKLRDGEGLRLQEEAKENLSPGR